MEKLHQEDYYKVLYGQLVKEYKRYIYRKKLINENPYKRKKKIQCPVCKSLNHDVSLFCENCGVRLKYSFLNYL